ncbi:CDP-4-dehydro-6-deoxyglucose reductase [Candidatus Kinetoplastibacterium oncopeltii TCC290E]|uniref:CDP-4-dehydro-6-deoxyglucose reductase n=1 Tax=Candidatus Kinetoplastidibacterium stringomonadis TCC290E TaxID=1208920 RepID=M1L728_9PROT|nr:2Fe-2S iron-sulfur cluster-binding protein [Candidatus Kinetoplastibacterium oncopeltii]AGF48393.1 CDP-4-dehydro-6-deoxyglucose reductase [Candidatus Kinetoplastibacterium oncopeltii TCC290E]
MSFSIIIKPSDEKFTVKTSKSILESATESGIHIPHGCKIGNCNRCKCKVLSGSFKIKNYLAECTDEYDNFNILACKAYPLSDMVIECENINHSKKHLGKIIAIEKLTNDVISLDIKLLEKDLFIFKEGQYVDMVFDKNIRRSYSISNAPRINNTLNFHIRHLPGGYFTDKLFGYDPEIIFRTNDIINLEGPFGDFTLKKESNNPIIFLASGTGFAPIKSMIEYILNFKKWRPIHLYWAVRNVKDIYMSNLINYWTNEIPYFNYTPVISSNLLINDDWSGRTGNLHSIVMEDISDMIEYEVYASGSPDMVELSKVNFISQCNLTESNFFADPFYT